MAGVEDSFSPGDNPNQQSSSSQSARREGRNRSVDRRFQRYRTRSFCPLQNPNERDDSTSTRHLKVLLETDDEIIISVPRQCTEMYENLRKWIASSKDLPPVKPNETNSEMKSQVLFGSDKVGTSTDPRDDRQLSPTDEDIGIPMATSSRNSSLSKIPSSRNDRGSDSDADVSNLSDVSVDRKNLASVSGATKLMEVMKILDSECPGEKQNKGTNAMKPEGTGSVTVYPRFKILKNDKQTLKRGNGHVFMGNRHMDIEKKPLLTSLPASKRHFVSTPVTPRPFEIKKEQTFTHRRLPSFHALAPTPFDSSNLDGGNLPAGNQKLEQHPSVSSIPDTTTTVQQAQTPTCQPTENCNTQTPYETTQFQPQTTQIQNRSSQQSSHIRNIPLIRPFPNTLPSISTSGVRRNQENETGILRESRMNLNSSSFHPGSAIVPSFNPYRNFSPPMIMPVHGQGPPLSPHPFINPNMPRQISTMPPVPNLPPSIEFGILPMQLQTTWPINSIPVPNIPPQPLLITSMHSPNLQSIASTQWEQITSVSWFLPFNPNYP